MDSAERGLMEVTVRINELGAMLNFTEDILVCSLCRLKAATRVSANVVF